MVPRALVAHTEGLLLLDTETGETLDAVEDDAFVRLSETGDGRHVAIAGDAGFRLYDTGLSADQHGDHAHFRTFTPGLLDQVRAAEGAGHVVPHAGRTTFFADGTGEISVVDTDELTDPDAYAEHRTDAPHHGVALTLADGSLLTTQGTEKERSSAQVIRDGQVVAETDACPGVHGEATAAPIVGDDVVVVLGCEDGPVVLRKGEFRKVEVDRPYVRTGNLAGHPDSPVVLTDWKVDPDADLERPEQVGLLDTRTDTLRTADLGSSYWFRSLGRGPHGEAVVLTYDGTLRVLDEETGKEVARIQAIKPWREKDDWQEPGPVLEVAGSYAYVSDALTNELVVVDLERAEVVRRLDLPHPAVELVVTTGVAADAAGDHGHDH
ncbi:hypothetical protein E2C04_03730 [Nocardioides daphniae]|uniref:Uncharacterized protein n=1 Tax=Nocardioides daphniae TaxID=402297 RepID=A0A4P7UB74_9ACTN|nr:hypothetical protein E2C04_03730 [Nocardioides daphniae]